jgi:hypothetical protein
MVAPRWEDVDEILIVPGVVVLRKLLRPLLGRFLLQPRLLARLLSCSLRRSSISAS